MSRGPLHVETPGGSRRGGARERRRGWRGRVWSAFQRARSRFTRGVRLGNRVRRHRDNHSGRRAQSSRGGDVPGRFSAGAHAPPPTHVDRPPSHIPPASVASASVASGHSPRSSHPTTPTRGGPRGSGLSARYVSTHQRVAFHLSIPKHRHRVSPNYHPITDDSPPTNHQPRRSRRRREDLISRSQPRGSSHRIRCSRAPAAPPNRVGVQRWTGRVATAASQGRRRRVRPRGDTAGGEFLLLFPYGQFD